MRPFGREKKVKGGGAWKKDYHLHPKHLVKNWWEGICDFLPRTTQKINLRREINKAMES